MSDQATKFTKQQLNDWRRCEKVRSSGLWNMFDPRELEVMGITLERYLFVLKNYWALRDAQPKKPNEQ